jgi:DNA adenine methylase
MNSQLTITESADKNNSIIPYISARPFLKWVGGKRSILPELMVRIPKNYISYYEPFLGGGALFFALKPKKAVLSDINFHLIITFQSVRDRVENLISHLESHARKHSKEYFLKSRIQLSKENDPVKIAAILIYLNKTCFNGLYRVNSEGKFNVPLGDYKNPSIVDKDNLRAASKALQNIEILQMDFSQILPKKGSFYYLDPPYHETYDGYSGHGFRDDKHIQLAEYCHLIDKKGGYFMLSNSNTQFVRHLYKDYNIEEVTAMRSVSCKANQRKKENELLIKNY